MNATQITGMRMLAEEMKNVQNAERFIREQLVAGAIENEILYIKVATQSRTGISYDQMLQIVRNIKAR